jgi:hypothetical protein
MYNIDDQTCENLQVFQYLALFTFLAILEKENWLLCVNCVPSMKSSLFSRKEMVP